MKVIALPEVREYLMELIQILYKKEYFGFEENAQKYVEDKKQPSAKAKQAGTSLFWQVRKEDVIRYVPEK